MHSHKINLPRWSGFPNYGTWQMETDWKMSILSQIIKTLQQWPVFIHSVSQSVSQSFYLHSSSVCHGQMVEPKTYYQNHFKATLLLQAFRLFYDPVKSNSTVAPLDISSLLSWTLSPCCFGACALVVLTGGCTSVYCPSLCLPRMVRQEAGQTAVSLSQCWILSARCEEDFTDITVMG